MVSARGLRAPEAVELAAFALGRAARAGLADSDTWQPLHHGNRRAVVNEACRRDGGPDPLIDDGDHLEDALALHECFDAIADLHRRRRLGRGAVHADMAATARGCRRRTALVEPDGPQPNVHTGGVHLINRAACAWRGAALVSSARASGSVMATRSVASSRMSRAS